MKSNLPSGQCRARLRKVHDKLVEGMDRLTDAEEILQKTEAHIKGMEGTQIDSLRKSTKKMQDEIKSIREFISGKPQTRQGYGSVPANNGAQSIATGICCN